jgi:hypothetical protein
MFIFACPKTNPKRQPFTWFDSVELPCAARSKQTPRKVAKFMPPCGVLRRVVSLLFAALLGCVKWQVQIFPLYFHK